MQYTNLKTIDMHSSCRYGVSNSVKKEELAREYDVDHEITAAIAEVDNIIESCDFGYGLPFEKQTNESLIIKAVINHLIEKL